MLPASCVRTEPELRQADGEEDKEEGGAWGVLPV